MLPGLSGGEPPLDGMSQSPGQPFHQFVIVAGRHQLRAGGPRRQHGKGAGGHRHVGPWRVAVVHGDGIAAPAVRAELAPAVVDLAVLVDAPVVCLRVGAPPPRSPARGCRGLTARRSGSRDLLSCARLGHMVHIGVVAMGVADVERAARFWCAALGYERGEDGFGGWPLVLAPPDGVGTVLALQRSTTPPRDHPRTHLDLHVTDAVEQAAEVDRLVSLGAELVDWDSYPADPDFVVLADPDGNRFCIVDLGHG